MNTPNTLTKPARLAESARRLMLGSRIRRLGSAVSAVTTEGDFRISHYIYDDEYPIVKGSVDETGFCTELLGVQTSNIGILQGGASLEHMTGSPPAISVWARAEGWPTDRRVSLPHKGESSNTLVLPEHIIVVSELTRHIREYSKDRH